MVAQLLELMMYCDERCGIALQTIGGNLEGPEEIYEEAKLLEEICLHFWQSVCIVASLHIYLHVEDSLSGDQQRIPASVAWLQHSEELDTTPRLLLLQRDAMSFRIEEADQRE